MFKTIDDVNQWLATKSPINQIENFKCFLQDVGNPQKKLKTIHVAGTNGKGSCVSYLYSILRSASYRVATFTSPYLHHPNDRIRINNDMIQDEAILSILQRYQAQINHYHLSTYEIDMFLSLIYFLNHDVDICIYEVGLGGRLDATNVIEPILSIITNISKDHMNYLGNTVERIAYEKAGIIKQGIPLFTSETKEACLTVFKNTCLEKQAPFTQVPCPNYHKEKDLIFTMDDLEIKLNTPALYQVKNASLVYACIDYLRHHGFNLSNEAIRDGFYHAFWPGRFEIIHEHPIMILDGCHNEDGVLSFVESAKAYKNSIIVFSGLKDKELVKMLTDLKELDAKLILTSFEDERIGQLKDIAFSLNLDYIEDYRGIIDSLMNQDQTVFYIGSLHFVSKVRAYVFEKKGESTLSRSMYGN